MNFITCLVPALLLTHNPVSFSTNDCEDNVACLNFLVTNYADMLETYNSDLRLINNAGHIDDKIHSLELQFESTAKYSLEEARLMMLQLVDSFLDSLHRFPRVSGRLACPFTAENITIRVNFVSPCYLDFFETKYIKYMSFMNGAITYDIENSYNPCQLVTLRCESLAQARAVAELLGSPKSPFCYPKP